MVRVCCHEAGQPPDGAVHPAGPVPEDVDGRRGKPERAVALGHRHDPEPRLDGTERVGDAARRVARVEGRATRTRQACEVHGQAPRHALLEEDRRIGRDPADHAHAEEALDLLEIARVEEDRHRLAPLERLAGGRPACAEIGHGLEGRRHDGGPERNAITLLRASLCLEAASQQSSRTSPTLGTGPRPSSADPHRRINPDQIAGN